MADISIVLNYVAGLTNCPACGHPISAHTWTQSAVSQDSATSYDFKLFYSCSQGNETCLFEGTPSGVTATIIATPSAGGAATP
jgi:hypothetical protein